ncbi:unnamed protein product [Cyclocybe aegerita]|uniref:Uncharacterized protein n=1 Tax=Cyclocybe aegerita TaxID=1973307 RepID=A0A8S0XSV6_CYCAE|nr:unnamed protein product [Cyclocybe aegerita]
MEALSEVIGRFEYLQPPVDHEPSIASSEGWVSPPDSDIGDFNGPDLSEVLEQFESLQLPPDPETSIASSEGTMSPPNSDAGDSNDSDPTLAVMQSGQPLAAQVLARLGGHLMVVIDPILQLLYLLGLFFVGLWRGFTSVMGWQGDS